MPEGHACHPPPRRSQHSAFLPWPTSHALGAPRGPQVRCQGLWEAAGWHGWVARPHLQLGVPPLSLQAESAGPQMPWLPVPYKWSWGHVGNLGEECPMSTAQDSCRPLPPLATIAMHLSLRAGRGHEELRLAGRSPLPLPVLSAQPRRQRVSSFIPTSHLLVLHPDLLVSDTACSPSCPLCARPVPPPGWQSC